MNLQSALTIVAYVLPAMVVILINNLIFKRVLEQQVKISRGLLQQSLEKKLDSNALKLQALERLTLLIERIDLQNLILRVPLATQDKSAYTLALIQHINQEVDYNITQQLYVSDALWELIITQQQTIIATIQQLGQDSTYANSNELQQELFQRAIPLKNNTKITLQAIKSQAVELL
ncbi:DUF7935 family protein [Myroides sp. LJL115]